MFKKDGISTCYYNVLLDSMLFINIYLYNTFLTYITSRVIGYGCKRSTKK